MTKTIDASGRLIHGACHRSAFAWARWLAIMVSLFENSNQESPTGKPLLCLYRLQAFEGQALRVSYAGQIKLANERCDRIAITVG
jgi:hypothetical protein